MRPTRRQFAQGMAAGLAGLVLPSAASSSALAAPSGPNPRSGHGLDERAIQDALDASSAEPASRPQRPTQGQIGEGRPAPLSKAQRKRAL